jgi:hypothetical protein
LVPRERDEARADARFGVDVAFLAFGRLARFEATGRAGVIASS